MLDLIEGHVHRGESFAFETTLSGRSYARQIPLWRQQGYFVRLVFLALDSPDSAVARVAMRVSQGGHNIPESTIRRRFEAGLRNFHLVYKTLVEKWEYFDNSGMAPVLIEEGRNV